MSTPQEVISDPEQPLSESETPKEVQPSMDYLESVYDLYRAPDSPSWGDMKPRIERYLEHVFKESTE